MPYISSIFRRFFMDPRSTGTNYRFMLPISEFAQREFGGAPIYVYGISPFPQLPNLLLFNRAPSEFPRSNLIGRPKLGKAKEGHVKMQMGRTVLAM